MFDDLDKYKKPGKPGPKEILFLAIPFTFVVLLLLYEMNFFSN